MIHRGARPPNRLRASAAPARRSAPASSSTSVNDADRRRRRSSSRSPRTRCPRASSRSRAARRPPVITQNTMRAIHRALVRQRESEDKRNAPWAGISWFVWTPACSRACGRAAPRQRCSHASSRPPAAPFSILSATLAKKEARGGPCTSCLDTPSRKILGSPGESRELE